MSEVGSVFISYSGDRATIGEVATALRRVGMRPWRDAENLPLGARTRDEILSELAGCRAAMVWLTRTTLDSDYVCGVELPAIVDEHERRGIVIIPVFVEWQPGAEANAAVRAAIGREIGDLNGFVWDATASTREEAARLAQHYAAAAMPTFAIGGTRPIVRCATRTDAAPNRDTAHANLDWRVEYPSDGSLPDEQTTADLRAALAAAADDVLTSFGGGEVNVSARCHLHLGVALGHAFRRPTGLIPVVPVDESAWRAEIVTKSATSLLNVTERAAGPASAKRAAVEVAISREVTAGVDRTVSEAGVEYAARVVLAPPDGAGQTALPNSTTANVWASQVADLIAELRNRPRIAEIDLYLAAPIQFAVLLGWRLNVGGPIHLFHWHENAGPYREVWTLPPS